MDSSARRLVSRAELARYAEVSRAAVTNWSKRDSSFPNPVPGENNLFGLDQVINWLSARVIPAGARHPHEPVGTTYADRVRARTEESGTRVPQHEAAPVESKEKDVQQAQRLILQALDRLGGPSHLRDIGSFLLTLLYLCAEHEPLWRSLRHGRAKAALLSLPNDIVSALPSHFDHNLGQLEPEVLHEVCQDITLIGSAPDRRARLTTAFDHLLALMEKDMRAGILRTPDSVVDAVVGLFATDPAPRHVLDPYCRTGEFLLASEHLAPTKPTSRRPQLSGSSAVADQVFTTRMNLAMHDVRGEIHHGHFGPELLPEPPKADILLTNPPFNLRALPITASPPPIGRGETPEGDQRFPYGEPPKSNTNYAWLQYAVAMLAPNGRAAVLMPTNASFSHNRQERSIRAAMVEDGAVEAVMALPSQLFPTTGIPVNLWILRRPTGSCSEMLFVDASGLGTMVSRTLRELTPQDTGAIHAAYQSWRSSGALEEEHSGLGRVVTMDEIRALDYSLHPPSYVMDQETEDAQAQAHSNKRFEELTRQLATLESRTSAVDARVQDLLKEVRDKWTR